MRQYQHFKKKPGSLFLLTYSALALVVTALSFKKVHATSYTFPGNLTSPTTANTTFNVGDTVNINSGTFENANTGTSAPYTITNASTAFNINTGATLKNDSTATITNNGTIITNGTGAILNQGIFNSTSILTINTSGTVTNTNAATFTNSGTLTNNGAFTNQTGGAFFNSGTLAGTGLYLNQGGMTFTNTTATSVPNLQNDGTLTFSGMTGALTIQNLTGSMGSFSGGTNGLIVNGGTYSGGFGSMASFTKATTGTLTLNGSSSVGAAAVSVTGGSLLVGDSTHGTSTFSTTGNITVSSGATLGGYGVTQGANVTLSSGSTYEVGLSGNSTSGEIMASGNLIVTGSTLAVETDGTVPASGGTYTIASYGGNLTGNFAAIQPIGFAEVLGINYGSGVGGVITLTATAPANLATLSDPSGGINDNMTNLTSSLPLSGAWTSDPGSAFNFNKLSFNSRGKTTPHNRFQATGVTHLTHQSIASSSKDTKESVLQALAENGPIVSENREHGFWISPYYIQGNTRNINTRVHSKDRFEGAAMGLERRSLAGRWVVGITASAGLGQQRLPGSTSFNTKVSSNTTSLGVYHSKEFLSNGRYDLNVNGFYTRLHSKRYGSPTPGSLYLAKGSLNSSALMGNFLTSWVFPMKNGFSVRPSVGVSGGFISRSGFSETNAGIYNQRYARRNTHSLEPYAGIGLRRKWTTSNGAYEWKITGIVEQGYETGTSNNGGTGNVSLTSGLAQTMSVPTRGFGRAATYFTLYASVFNVDKKFKTLLGVTSTLQRYHTSNAVVARFEWHW